VNAIISGSAGVAVVVDGKKLFSIDIDRLGDLVPRRADEVRFLFGDARDQWFVEKVSAGEARQLLEQEWDRAEALAVTLILLDSGLSEETRLQAAHDLEETLGASGSAARLEAVLYARALPGSADMAGALRFCVQAKATAARALLDGVHARQSAIWEVADAFARLPLDVFGNKEEDRADAQAALVRAGVFWDLASARANGQAVSAAIAVALQRASVKSIKNHRGILTAWAKPLSQVRSVVREAETDEAREPESTRSNSKYKPPASVDRAKVLENVKSQKQLIVNAMSQRDVPRARTLVGELVDYQLKNGAPVYVAMSLCDLAVQAQRRQLYELQVDLLRRATQLRADDAWSWAQLGKALQNVHDYPGALLAYENARQYGVGVVSETGRAEVLKAMGNLPGALLAYEEVAKAHPDNVVAKNGRAEVLKAMGSLPAALLAYEEAAKAHPSDVFVKSGRAEVLKAMGNLPAALLAYEDAAKAHPENVVTKTGRAEVLKAMGSLRAALLAYEEATKAHPSDVVAKNGHANVLAAMGRWDEALELLPAALPAAEQDWIGYHLRGMVLLRSGNMSAAEQIFEHGVQHDPFATSRDYYRTALAVVRLRRRQYRSVLELLSQVSLPLFQVPANLLRTHALVFEGDVASAAATYALLPDQGLPVYLDIRHELGRRLPGAGPPRHDEPWLFDREIELLAAA
jgi:tetratricopeptide (TPR) repeat protein